MATSGEGEGGRPGPGLPAVYPDRVVVDPEAGCVLWTGTTDRDGYAVLVEAGREVRGHRRSWEVAHGRPVPAGLVVAHTCDRPGCVNPDHLEAKTQAENVGDRQRRGRQARGERNGRARLTARQVAAAKRVLADGAVPDARLARLLGVSPSVVRDIKAGRTWAHVEAE